MTIEEAIDVMESSEEMPFGKVAFAAGIIASSENARRVTFRQLLLCLKRGNKYHRLTTIQEVAALALYRETGRAREEPVVPYQDLITSESDWLEYLKAHGFWKPEWKDEEFAAHVGASGS